LKSGNYRPTLFFASSESSVGTIGTIATPDTLRRGDGMSKPESSLSSPRKDTSVLLETLDAGRSEQRSENSDCLEIKTTMPPGSLNQCTATNGIPVSEKCITTLFLILYTTTSISDFCAQESEEIAITPGTCNFEAKTKPSNTCLSGLSSKLSKGSFYFVATPVKKNADSIEAIITSFGPATEGHICEVEYMGTATNTNTITLQPGENLSFKVGGENGIIQFANTFPIDKSIQCSGTVTQGDKIATTVQFNTPPPTTVRLMSQKSICPVKSTKS
jgi:hypothetical protein